jgi:glycosyltransferase involved in cell wall biosynthesis
MGTAVARISIVIPTRDRPQDLRRCLAAVLECAKELSPGTDALHEVVVVDDGSTVPGSTAAAERSPLPVRVLRNATSAGAASARELAASEATGDILAFLDDDAFPRGDWLAVASSALRDWPAVTGRVLRFDAGLVSAARQARYDARYAGIRAGTPVGFLAGGNSAIPMALFREVGGFRRHGTGGDNSLAESLLERGTPACFHPDLVVAHRNSKGLRRAVIDAWFSGTGHPERLTAPGALHALALSGIGDTGAVRAVNRMLGAVHATGRTLPRTI